MPFETAAPQWQEGERRLQSAAPSERAALEHVTEAIVDELRRRLGATFTTDQLAELYDRGTDWCLDLAVSAAPEAPHAWETSTVADAAFARYLRSATDWAGGRRIEVG